MFKRQQAQKPHYKNNTMSKIWKVIILHLTCTDTNIYQAFVRYPYVIMMYIGIYYIVILVVMGTNPA